MQLLPPPSHSVSCRDKEPSLKMKRVDEESFMMHISERITLLRGPCDVGYMWDLIGGQVFKAERVT